MNMKLNYLQAPLCFTSNFGDSEGCLRLCNMLHNMSRCILHLFSILRQIELFLHSFLNPKVSIIDFFANIIPHKCAE